MGLTSLQVCMDSSDWLQGTMQDDESSAGTGGGINNNSSSSPSGDGGGGDSNIMGCSSGPMRLKPPADQAQKCPRCESAHTKFCYYNNYSLSQPRYFCKTCRRYWTKGGTLRNIPVGGGCRKNTSHKNNNKHNNKRTNSNSNNDHHVTSTTVPTTNHTDLQLSTLIGAHHLNNHYNNIPNFLVDFADPQQMGALRNYDVMGNINISNNNNNNHLGMDQTTLLAPSFQGLCSPFGIMGLDQHVDSYQRFMVPYDVAFEQEHQNAAAIDVKPKLLALDQWQDQGRGDHIGNRDSFAGYMGSWSGMINGYGSSAANPLV